MTHSYPTLRSSDLMAVFRDDASQRGRWLTASTNRIEKSFRPGQMRQAAGFSHSEYKQHCTWGGHPNPSARWLLPNHRGKRSEEHTSELQSLMRISYADFRLKKKNQKKQSYT